MTSSSVTTWIGKLKVGQSDAAQQLWELYYARLVALARRKMSGLSRRVTDEEDVALSAFHSFCRAVDAGRFPRLENRDDLWQILVMHTARKAIDQRRYQGRQKRLGSESDAMLHTVIGREPAPEFAAAVAEEFQHLMKLLDEEMLRDIAMRKLEGYTNPEIAKLLVCSLRTVERKLAIVRGIWEEALGNE